MDAPGANTANGGAEKGLAENATPTTPSRDLNTTPDKHNRRHRGSDYGSESDDGEEGDEGDEEEDEDESDGEEEEPRLKYAYLTKHLGSVYRNGDATSTFLVAGDKMVRAIFKLETQRTY